MYNPEKKEELIQALDLYDTWRCSNPNDRKYTFTFCKRQIKLSRLDFVLVTSDIHAKIVKKHILWI